MNEFEDMYRAAAPAVFAWISLHLHGPLQAELDPEDVLQEVAVRAYANRDKYDASRGEFRGWLFGIARNVLLKVLERVGPASHHGRDWLSTGDFASLPEEATSVTRRAARSDGVHALLAKINGLDEDERQLVIHRGLEGLPSARLPTCSAWSRRPCRSVGNGYALDCVRARG